MIPFMAFFPSYCNVSQQTSNVVVSMSRSIPAAKPKSIAAFLADSAKAVQDKTVKTVVMGNEGCDMDSAIGSLYLAYALDQLDVYPKPVVPLINIPISDLPLRGDIVLALKTNGVSPNSLISCWPDPDDPRAVVLPLLTWPDRIGVVLVDHNKLSSVQTSLAKNVVGVVDHHKDENLYEDQTKALRVIEVVGSACSLVAQLFADRGIPVPSPTLLYAAILLDTKLFDPATKKTTPRDLSIRDFLEPMLVDTTSETWFDALHKAKSDISSLTIPQQLRRDYKNFDFKTADGTPIGVGMSTIEMLSGEIYKLYGADAWIAALKQYRSQQKRQLQLVMFTAHKQRELGVLAGNLSTLKLIQDFFTQNPVIGFVLKSMQILVSTKDAEETWAVYAQTDTTYSRKLLSPLIETSISSATKVTLPPVAAPVSRRRCPFAVLSDNRVIVAIGLTVALGTIVMKLFRQ